MTLFIRSLQNCFSIPSQALNSKLQPNMLCTIFNTLDRAKTWFQHLQPAPVEFDGVDGINPAALEAANPVVAVLTKASKVHGGKRAARRRRSAANVESLAVVIPENMEIPVAVIPENTEIQVAVVPENMEIPVAVIPENMELTKVLPKLHAPYMFPAARMFMNNSAPGGKYIIFNVAEDMIDEMLEEVNRMKPSKRHTYRTRIMEAGTNAAVRFNVNEGYFERRLTAGLRSKHKRSDGSMDPSEWCPIVSHEARLHLAALERRVDWVFFAFRQPVCLATRQKSESQWRQASLAELEPTRG